MRTATCAVCSLFLRAAILLMLTGSALAQQPEAASAEGKDQRDARIAWWREGRFGLFIHWGPVSLKGTEISWSRANSNPKCPNRGQIPVDVYDNLYREFNPVQFDAAQWAAIAKEAGTRYVVLTAKHCDGFLLWHSNADGYNISATPFKRDICAELAAAVRKEGLKIGWYFSPMDWRDPDFRTDRNAEFLRRMQAEVCEVLSDFGRIDLLWFDHDGREAMYDQAHTYALVKKLQPQIVINNRLDLSVGDSNRKILSPFADYYTPEQELGSYDDQRPWETCMTLGTQWAWKPDDRIKSIPQVLGILARCAGGDGNLLLNVGPMPDGRIEPRQVDVLKGVGAWLKQNGEAIYATRGGPYKPGDYGASTRKGSTIYLHILRWNADGVALPPLPKRVVSASLLAGGEVKFEQDASALRITVPAKDRHEGDTVVKLELNGSAMEIPAIATTR